MCVCGCVSICLNACGLVVINLNACGRVVIDLHVWACRDRSQCVMIDVGVS